METSEAGLDHIKRWEGWSPVVYRDPVGLPTIGYGHLILANEVAIDGTKTTWSDIQPIDETIGLSLLFADVWDAESAVRRYISVSLNQRQFDALVSWTFNCGAGALQRSTLRAVLNRGEYGAVPDEFLKWVKGGRPLRIIKGLVNRRRSEGRLFQS